MFFIIFKRLILKERKPTFLEGQNPAIMSKIHPLANEINFCNNDKREDESNISLNIDVLTFI